MSKSFGGENNSGIGRFGVDCALDEFTTDHWATVQHTRPTYPFGFFHKPQTRGPSHSKECDPMAPRAQSDGAPGHSHSRHIIRSVSPEHGVSTGAARVATSGPDGHLTIALNAGVREASVELLDQLLADTVTLRDLYKKHHWQAAGRQFYSLHLLFDKHYAEQAELVNESAERIRILGGISVAMGADVAQLTQVPRPPKGRESTDLQRERLLQAHEIVLLQSHAAARQASESGDDGTNDLFVSSVIRTNEMQAWFIGQHLAAENEVPAGTDGPDPTA